ncbi:MAG: hypothetical protein Q9167_004501 [Letrouitia subvulpina]
MSSSAGLRRTRSATSAGSSRASSGEPPSIIYSNSETSSKAGSKTRSKAGSKAGSDTGSNVTKRTQRVGGSDQVLYGSEAVTATEQQLRAAHMGRAVGGIESAIGQARRGKKANPCTKVRQHLDPVPEENLSIVEPAAPSAIQETSGGIFEPSRMTAAPNEESLADPDDRGQPLFEDPDFQIPSEVREPQVRFFWSAKQAVSLFLVLFTIILAFTDIYRGPLLGGNYDLLGIRSMLSQAPANQTMDQPSPSWALQQLHHRIHLLEEQLGHYLLQIPKQHPVQVNFFSPTKGAIVNPELSSPHKTVELNCNDPVAPKVKVIPEPFWKNIFKSQKKCKFEFNGPPAAVFLPWDDAQGPNWCAPPSAGLSAKMQLQVILGAPVSPTELVVEHNPKAAELYRVAAPKEIELWMDVPDDEDRAAIGQAFDSFYPAASTEWTPRYQDASLPYTYVPVGRWEYFYHSREHIQHFPVEIDLRGVSSYNVALRVKSTWNKNIATCLYRVRLHGAVGPVSPLRESWLRPDLPRSSLVEQ